MSSGIVISGELQDGSLEVRAIIITREPLEPGRQTRWGIDKSSLERLVPDELLKDEATELQTIKLHIERYEFAHESWSIPLQFSILPVVSDTAHA